MVRNVSFPIQSNEFFQKNFSEREKKLPMVHDSEERTVANEPVGCKLYRDQSKGNLRKGSRKINFSYQ